MNWRLASAGRFSWWRRAFGLGRSTSRGLRLCESLPLGERRFVAVIEFEQTRFLVGGTPSSLALLARLEPVADASPASAPGAENRVATRKERP